MTRTVRTTIVPRRSGEEILVVNVARDGQFASDRSLAHRVFNAMRTKIPIDKIALDVVVVFDAEPNEQPIVIGSSAEDEDYVRSLSPQLAGYGWQLSALDW